ncbi:hypothetical protein SLEP1_g33756 [Rubroshorea leprosula]|uniref:Kinesin-like protein n=1 Tax=Rubroshorea leprosula TaxID=152421 RepID=A0AAV5KHM3_9ROSI|nr:hypothetical protein SLEP1_g33756 [Rubroshorea leprosula]
MGAIGGEELKKLEKLQMASAREERILVLVRLRPLSEREISADEVADWECINDNTILYRNTLREGSTFPSAYTFDRVFRGDSSTKQVYEEEAKEIALSVVNGINSSIFAYGQTSSGKTYTMTGITEYAVADIFDYIHKHEERAFAMKFSAIEIYNEAIRDLLSTDNTPLRLRDDPERGTIVEKVTEETLRDWNHLQELLSICEAQRRIGETSLNEKSSRSHQIIRLTIESSAREFLGKENSTTLAASVNFVDLAGSERASQSLSSGARLKEGCHINRSLLTLSTVVRKLSKGRQGHINYRDSKLTRILQPCLGGNARTAIICTLSPARGHVEQTRNTLLFACCAKEVTTKAQVNVVMSDKALVKHLQRELARLESELRSPAPISSNSDYAALLRKKDLQIQKMEKEIRELTQQRDLAHARVEDLLRIVGQDQYSEQSARASLHPDQQVGDAWEDEYSASEAESHQQDVGFKKLNRSHSNDTESDENQKNTEDHFVSDDDPDEQCKEVQCIEIENSSRDNNSEFHTLPDGENEGMPTLAPDDGNIAGQEILSMPLNGDREVNHVQSGFTYDALEQGLHDVQRTVDSLVRPSPNESSLAAAESSSSRSLKLTRSWSCRADVMASDNASTPPALEKNFPGRPEGYGGKFPLLNYGANDGVLTRNNSQSSLGSASVDDVNANRIKSSTDEDITSIQTFVAGLKKQLVDVQGTGLDTENLGNSMKDVGFNPMHEAPGTLSDWPLEFERQQRAITELWQACHVSLVHRTYFFLLFKGDPTDSIYLGVEHRRLSFLKETFSQGNKAVHDGQTLTLASSMRALRRERETLSKLMRRRFSEEERLQLYQKWDIGLNSKQRRLQLVNQLWTDTNNMERIKESATIVAKLIRFVEQGQAIKEMFGLSFTPARPRRRSFGWKNSMASLL